MGVILLDELHRLDRCMNRVTTRLKLMVGVRLRRKHRIRWFVHANLLLIRFADFDALHQKTVRVAPHGPNTTDTLSPRQQQRLCVTLNVSLF